MMTPPRCAIYLRVSSEEQAKEGLSLASQERACRETATRQGYAVVAVHRDEGFSAFSRKPRPAFLDLLRHLSEYDVVMVWRLDRFGRRKREIFNSIGDLLDSNVGFYSVTERHDLTTPLGRAMLGVAASFAELEVEQTQERVLAGQAEVVAQGRKLGFAPYGYYLPRDAAGSVLPKGIIQPDPATAPIVCRVFRDYAAGQSPVDIARALTAEGIPTMRGGPVWQPGTIRSMLRRVTYTGRLQHRGTLTDGLHEAIIDRVTWEACQRRLTRLALVPPRSRTASLHPLIRCGYCGTPLRVHYSDGLRYYRCGTGHIDREHPSLYMSERFLEGYIWLLVDELAAGVPTWTLRRQRKPTRKLKALREEQATLEGQLRYNLAAAREGAIPLHLLATENAPLQARLDVVTEALRRLLDTDEPLALSAPTIAEARASGFEVKREFLSRLFSAVEVYRDRIVFQPRHADLPPLAIRRLAHPGNKAKYLRLEFIQ